MLEHEQGAERVNAEGQQGVVGIDIDERLLRERHAWEDKGEMEAMGRCRENIRARSGRIDDGGFI